MPQDDVGPFYSNIFRSFNIHKNIPLALVMKTQLPNSINSFFNVSKLNHSRTDFQPRVHRDELHRHFKRMFAVEGVDYQRLDYRFLGNLVIEKTHRITVELFQLSYGWHFVDDKGVLELRERLDYSLFDFYAAEPLFELFCVLLRHRPYNEIFSLLVNFYFRYLDISVENFEDAMNYLIAVIEKKQFFLNSFPYEDLTDI